MSKNLYEALEICLQALGQGADIEACLADFPGLADELRPLLEAAMQARALAAPDIPVDVMRRGRARLLQHAAQMREAANAPRRRTFSLQRATVALMLVVFFTLSGTGLVKASSTSIPGDNLYLVKRTWEDVRLWLAPEVERETLEHEYENERLEEVNELFEHGRAADVAFAGVVTEQNGDRWVVAGIPVVVTAQTELSDLVTVGMTVVVSGQTRSEGVVLAQQIALLPAGTALPLLESNEDGDPGPEKGESPGMTELPETPESSSAVTETETPEPEEGSQPGAEEHNFELEGRVEKIEGGVWTVDGTPIYFDQASSIEQGISAGSFVKVEGTIAPDGSYHASKIESSKASDGGDAGGGGTGMGNDDYGSDGGPTPTPDGNDGGDDDGVDDGDNH